MKSQHCKDTEKGSQDLKQKAVVVLCVKKHGFLTFGVFSVMPCKNKGLNTPLHFLSVHKCVKAFYKIMHFPL